MNKSIYNALKPWMIKPFHFLFHGEVHYLNSSDYDKRIAYINFDNSIEVSIYAFMHSNACKKGLNIYKKENLDKVKNSFYDKLEVFESYIQGKKLLVRWDKDDINYYHEQRNSQYHDASLSSPDTQELDTIRQIAIWIFSVLFEISDMESLLKFALNESEKSFPEIPRDFAIPKVEGILQTHENSLFIASILGGWNENLQSDKNMVELLQVDFNQWINDIQEINNYNDEIFLSINGHWQVKNKIKLLEEYASFFYDSHLNLIKTIALEVLSEIHPMFDLKSKDRFAAVIYGKTSKYSSKLRKGISETLAFLGIYGSKLKNCTLHNPEDISILTIRELFKDADWKLWASLNEILPILAETAPNEFLTAVENSLKQTPCPFDELFKQEGKGEIGDTNYMTGLYWALETLAWSEEYLTRSILVLAELAIHDPGGRYLNRPINSISSILLPWMPQTTASMNTRIASLRGVQRKSPYIAGKALLSLLPSRTQFPIISHKPKFRNFIPENWKTEIPTNEYWEQVHEYAKMAVDMAKENIPYVSELVKNLDNIPQPSFDTLLEYLSSDEIVNLPDEQKHPIWETLLAYIRKHRRFPDAKWALSSEMINLLQKIADKIKPTTPDYLYQHLFSNRDYEFLERNLDWDARQKIILKQRIEAIKQIYTINKTNSVINFAEHVNSPKEVGNTFAHIANEENDNELFPVFLDFQEQYKKEFISGYIWSRYYLKGLNWIDSLNPGFWTTEQKCTLLINLPFEKEIWEKADALLGDYVGDYWKKINANSFPTQNNLLLAIKKLLQYGRPRLALNYIFVHYSSKKEFYKDEAIKALIDSASSDDFTDTMNPYRTTEIIKMLQNDPQIDDDILFKIEWMYFSILNLDYDAEPKLLDKKLSQDPDFFIEVIQLAYRSRNQLKEHDSNEIKKEIALNAFKLLNGWKRPPGKLDDGSFSDVALKIWLEEVKRRTIESGHLEVSMVRLGHVLFYAGPDPNGLWIQKSVAEILEEDEHIRRGFRTEASNSRGFYTIDPSGKRENEIADSWRKKADEVEDLGLIHFASDLKKLAKSYDREAERVVVDFAKEQEYSDDEGEL